MVTKTQATATAEAIASQLLAKYHTPIWEVWSNIPTCTRLKWTRTAIEALGETAPPTLIASALAERLRPLALEFDPRIIDHHYLRDCLATSPDFTCPSAH